MSEFHHTLHDGARLAVTCIGSGSPVVLLHAGPTTQRMWDQVSSTLARDHLVVTYDFRGFGHSDPTSAAFRHADDLVELCAALGVERPALVGNSLGGRVALDAAVLHPTLFERLVLFAPGLANTAPRDPFTVDIEQQITDAVSRLDAPTIIELVRRNWVSGPRRPADAPNPAIHSAVTDMLAENLAVGARSTGHERPVPDVVERLGTLALPISIIIVTATPPTSPPGLGHRIHRTERTGHAPSGHRASHPPRRSRRHHRRDQGLNAGVGSRNGDRSAGPANRVGCGHVVPRFRRVPPSRNAGAACSGPTGSSRRYALDDHSVRRTAIRRGAQSDQSTLTRGRRPPPRAQTGARRR